MRRIEIIMERGLFASRWLMAPFYVGLALSLILLLASFLRELMHFFLLLPQGVSQTDVILATLSLIDLSLAGNLVLIVIFSGYENFVSKLDLEDHADKPEWQGTVDFSTLKLKLVASIVAISGIQLLKVFMDIEKVNPDHVKWMVLVHVVFVVSGVLLALMDRISASTRALKDSSAPPAKGKKAS